MNTINKPKPFDIDSLFPTDMDFSQLLNRLGMHNRDIMATVINPARKDEIYKSGRVTGFKSGLWGGGHSKFKNGFATSFDSTKMHWKKKPKVHITYNIFEFFGSEHSDWVDVDNCTFNIIKNT